MGADGKYFIAMTQSFTISERLVTAKADQT